MINSMREMQARRKRVRLEKQASGVFALVESSDPEAAEECPNCGMLDTHEQACCCKVGWAEPSHPED